MTNKDIKEANILIGLFDGWIHSGKSGNLANIYIKDGTQIHIDDFKYHNDWNWLMRVVDKIEDLDDRTYYLETCGRLCKICKANLDDNHSEDIIISEFHGMNTSSKIEAVWLCVVIFIEQYNEKKK